MWAGWSCSTTSSTSSWTPGSTTLLPGLPFVVSGLSGWPGRPEASMSVLLVTAAIWS